MTKTTNDDDEASLVKQIQYSIFAYNGNFNERITSDVVVMESFINTNLQQLTHHEATVSDVIQSNHHNNNINNRDSIQDIQHRQHIQHRSMSTYDYLYVQWQEAIRQLSWQLPESDRETTTVDNTSTNNNNASSTTMDLVNDVIRNDNNDVNTSFFHMWFQKLWNMHSTTTTTTSDMTTTNTRYYHTTVHLEEMCFYLQLIYNNNNNNNNMKTTTTSNTKSTFTSLVVDKVEDGTEIRPQQQRQQQQLISIKSLLLLAIFFHDAIYNVHSLTNEEDSAILLFEQSFAKYTNLHSIQIQMVVSYILATKHHTIDESTIITMDDNDLPYHPLSLFLDLDMAVLGKDALAYHQYSILIRKEYSFVPTDIYCSKRADILEQFLIQSKHIYHTSIFYNAFEERARNNLRQEIQLLRQGIIPS